MPRDVRMRGFASRTTVDAAIEWLDARLAPLEARPVAIGQVAGRVLAGDVVSALDVPSFDRAMMDGFAVHAADTQGATAYNPLESRIVGSSLPGHPFGGEVQRSQAVRIMTGAPLPTGTDAVLPAELAEATGDRLLVQGEVTPGKHISRRAEDIAAGSKLLVAGRRLRPQDLGVLASIGLNDVPVVRRPRVRIVVTGNELLPPDAPFEAHKIYDANSPMLHASVERDGGVPLCGVVPDRPEAILAAMREGTDVVLVSGGSSVGEEDHAPSILAQHGELAIHGIAMRPSSPTGMGLLEDRLVFLLPGNPVSCLCAYDFFAGRAIRALGGRSKAWPYHSLRLPMKRKLSSVVGRVDYARVRVIDGRVEPLAIGGASVLSSTTRADGFVVVPADSEGYPAGAEVEVMLYDQLI